MKTRRVRFRRPEINDLIEEVMEAAAHPDNDRRRHDSRPIIVGLEDPIAWCTIFGYDANRLYTDPSFAFAQLLMQKLWRWNHVHDDTPIEAEVPVFLSHYPEYTFLGLSVSFSEGGVPAIQTNHELTQNPEMSLLEPVDFLRSGLMPRVLEWYDVFRELADGRLNVRFPDWGRGCLDLAVQLRGYDHLVVDAIERPEFVHDLLGFLTRERCRWYDARDRYLGRARTRATIADDWLNVPFISPAFFEEFVLPRYLEIERFHRGIEYIHSCGNQTPLQPAMLTIESLPTFEVSPWTDLCRTVSNVHKSKRLVVSVHPNDVLVASTDQARKRLQEIVDACGDRTYRICTSGLTPLSPDIDAFTATISRWVDLAREVTV